MGDILYTLEGGTTFLESGKGNKKDGHPIGRMVYLPEINADHAYPCLRDSHPRQKEANFHGVFSAKTYQSPEGEKILGGKIIYETVEGEAVLEKGLVNFIEEVSGKTSTVSPGNNDNEELATDWR